MRLPSFCSSETNRFAFCIFCFIYFVLRLYCIQTRHLHLPRLGRCIVSDFIIFWAANAKQKKLGLVNDVDP